MSKELEQAKELVRMLEEKERQEKGKVEVLHTLKPGEVFKIGEYDFIVLHQKESGTLVISKDLMAKNERFGDNMDYKESNVRKIIENQIQPIIEKELGVNALIEHEVSLTSVDMQNEFGSIKCKVRPITFDEARMYNDLLVNEDLPDWYWTLTPWSTKERGWDSSIVVVSPAGDIRRYYYDCNCGVRPFCILKSNIFVSKKGE